MKSFDERFCITERGWQPRFKRDVSLLWFLAGMAWRNLTIGGRLRRRDRASMATGETIFIDGVVPGTKPAPAAAAPSSGARP